MPAHPDTTPGSPPAARPGRPVPRRERRAVVVCAYGGYLLMTFALGLLPGPLRWALAGVAAAAALYGAARLLLPPRLGTADGADGSLDERQLQLRNAAYLAAYRLVGALVILALLYAWLSGERGWWQPHSVWAWQAVFWGGWLLVVTLPTALLAWTEPDDL